MNRLDFRRAITSTRLRYPKTTHYLSLALLAVLLVGIVAATQIILPQELAFAGPVSGTGSNSTVTLFDGRCNRDPGQTLAVYLDNTGGYYFYAVNVGVGYFAMHVTSQTLNDKPAKGVHYVIAQNLGVQLWRLKTGELQATRIGPDGKVYSYLITCGLI